MTSTLAARHKKAAGVLDGGGLYIGGDWIEQSTGGRALHVDPTTGDSTAEATLAGPGEVDAAVRAAREAFPAWAAWPVNLRRQLLLKIAAAIRENLDKLAVVAALENGHPLQFGGGALTAADYFEYFAGWADKIPGHVVPSYPGGALDYTLPEPYGVIAAIPSWNGPLTGIGRKVAPALAAGNCVVLKPAELTPFSAQHFSRICADCGLPPGVLNVVPGGADAGKALVGHRDVDKITFTGSTPTARAVMAGALDNLTPGVFELGGKSANIIFEDADLERAAALSAHWGLIPMAGQGCLLPTRLFVHRSVYEKVIGLLVDAIRPVKIGDPLESTTGMGPLISQAACERVMGVITKTREEGSGSLVIGGDRPAGELADGFFVHPTIFRDVDPRSDLAKNEVFGPVLAVTPFSDEDEVIHLANDTRLGLAGYVQTRDVSRAHRVASRLQAGYISVNGVCPMPPSAPFGGQGDSGFGREGGLEGLLEFVRQKNVYIALD